MQPPRGTLASYRRHHAVLVLVGTHEGQLARMVVRVRQRRLDDRAERCLLARRQDDPMRAGERRVPERLARDALELIVELPEPQRPCHLDVPVGAGRNPRDEREERSGLDQMECADLAGWTELEQPDSSNGPQLLRVKGRLTSAHLVDDVPKPDLRAHSRAEARHCFSHSVRPPPGVQQAASR